MHVLCTWSLARIVGADIVSLGNIAGAACLISAVHR